MTDKLTNTLLYYSVSGLKAKSCRRCCGMNTYSSLAVISPPKLNLRDSKLGKCSRTPVPRDVLWAGRVCTAFSSTWGLLQSNQTSHDFADAHLAQKRPKLPEDNAQPALGNVALGFCKDYTVPAALLLTSGHDLALWILLDGIKR